MKLTKKIFLEETNKELKKNSKMNLAIQIAKINKEIPHFDFLIFPSYFKCKEIKNENELFLEINLYYKARYKLFIHYCHNSHPREIIKFLIGLSSCFHNLSSSLNHIIQLSYFNIFANKQGKPKIIIYPNNLFNYELNSKAQEFLKVFESPESKNDSDPKKYYLFVFGNIFLKCFYPPQLVQEFLHMRKQSRKQIKEMIPKFRSYSNSYVSKILKKYIDKLFNFCFLFDSTVNIEFKDITNYFLQNLFKEFESKERPSDPIDPFKETIKSIVTIGSNINDINTHMNDQISILKNPNDITNFDVLNQSIDLSTKIFSKDKIITYLLIQNTPLLNIFPPKKINNKHYKNVETINLLTIPPKAALEPQKYSDKILLSKNDYEKFIDIISKIQKTGFPSYGIEPIVNADIPQDILEQKIKNEFTEEGKVKFLYGISFLNNQFDRIANGLAKTINQYKEMQSEFKELLNQASSNATNKELANHIREIANKFKDEFSNLNEVREKIINPEALFFKINNELQLKKATRISIKALNNMFYLDLRELDLIDTKPDSKLLISVLKMNDLFNTIIINQYDFVKLIYEGRTKELGNVVQKELFKKIKHLPYFFQIIFGRLTKIIFLFQKIIFQSF